MSKSKQRGGTRSSRIPRPERQVNADDAFRRLIERANARGGGGDHCHGCGRALASGESTAVGTDRRGNPRVMARCCVGRLSVIVGFGVYLAAADAPAEWLAAVPAEGMA